MEILVISKCANDQLYNYIYNTRYSKHIDPDQKFFRNMIYGLKGNKVVDTITCITIPPVSARTHYKKDWKRQEFIQDGIKFICPAFYNKDSHRYVDQMNNTFDETIVWLKKTTGKKRAIICDPLIVHATDRIIRLSHKEKCPIIAVVTDLPLTWLKMGKTKKYSLSRCFNTIYNYLAEVSLKKYDGYVWLTEQMNKKENKKQKPYIILEGFADVNNQEGEGKIDLELPKRFMMYAGGIHKVFRIDNLLEAFVNVDVCDTHLLLFGDGDDVQTVKEYEKKTNRIKYCGVVPSSEIKTIESKATLLVNPRPSSDSYTSFSFPSKTIEYLGSGTATLSTRLPGIPSDYDQYLYWFDKEDVQSMAATIKTVLLKSDEELKTFGKKAQQYVIKTKNAAYQSSNILKLIDNI